MATDYLRWRAAEERIAALPFLSNARYNIPQTWTGRVPVSSVDLRVRTDSSRSI